MYKCMLTSTTFSFPKSVFKGPMILHLCESNALGVFFLADATSLDGSRFPTHTPPLPKRSQGYLLYLPILGLP